MTSKDYVMLADLIILLIKRLKVDNPKFSIPKFIKYISKEVTH